MADKKDKNSVKNNSTKSNPMREVFIEKVTVNMGVGGPGDHLESAKKLLIDLTGKKPEETRAKKRNPVFKIRKGLPLGARVTLRGDGALDFLKKALQSKKNHLLERNFDKQGNFAFGIKEYIDFPGAKYDPSMGMVGFDVCVTLKRKGYSIKKRRISPSKVGKEHVITKNEGVHFALQNLGVIFGEEQNR